MTTMIYHHPDCRQHDTGPGHPECPARMDAVLGALKAPEFADLRWQEAPLGSREQILRVHPAEHFDAIKGSIPTQGLTLVDGDTILSPGSFNAALRAVGGACAAVDAVVAGEVQNAFCALRPPGHHAEVARAMGFCLFNSVAVAAAHARAQHGLERVAVVDFDVHHGNGTQDIFEDKGEYLYISSHQSPLYPGTGRASERGVGNILNVPLAPYSASPEIRHAWSRQMEPFLREFKPQMLFISAGFDAHHLDPLASLDFTEEDFAWLTRKMMAVAEEHCQGRIVSVLEGGYNLEALGRCTAAHVGVLMREAKQ